MQRHHRLITVTFATALLLGACGSDSGSDGPTDSVTVSSDTPVDIATTADTSAVPDSVGDDAAASDDAESFVALWKGANIAVELDEAQCVLDGYIDPESFAAIKDGDLNEIGLVPQALADSEKYAKGLDTCFGDDTKRGIFEGVAALLGGEEGVEPEQVDCVGAALSKVYVDQTDEGIQMLTNQATASAQEAVFKQVLVDCGIDPTL